MKKPLLITIGVFILLFLFSLVAFPQVDSAGIQQVISTGVNIVDATGGQIIPNVPNSVTGGLITLIAGFIIRFFEKRHLRKKGKLND